MNKNIWGLAALMLGCAGRSMGPSQVFDAMVRESGSGAVAVESRLSDASSEVLTEYRKLAVSLAASNLPINPTEVLAAQFATDQPVAISDRQLHPDTVWVAIRYQDEGEGEVRFVREDGQWAFDLAREMASAMNQLRRASQLLATVKEARDTGQSLEMPEGDDD